ncbi:MAG TPA: Vi polysaccharide biosynthesis UDP-N-acetylglucosamine C-6 dehydrogenase TviB, partial [Pseudomonadales bacterium]|nr:Vi polysaccharide biosynthesis UDP-N-acetylglucosamine C-6 dehydrogenase TviB [Pseudomonadales bacterium]
MFNFVVEQANIAIIGLGYVGLPLAVEFGKRYPTIGFDINIDRINELKNNHDSTLEVSDAELRGSSQLRFSNDPAPLQGANVYIVTVPTPIDRHRRPDLTPLQGASRTIGQVIKPGDVVIFESTVFP